ncbi:MAG TPA: M23 family metallopeptidase [Candidatus Eremiobacteraceae bacterium]|nr:M23 family metallopeptidase [Candidatus Eremiobacteraceae bacterium]
MRRTVQRGREVLKELFSSTKRIVIKIIPHSSESIYKLEVSHRHLAVIGAGVLVFLAAMTTFQLGAVNAANAQVRKLQASDAQQHRQLAAFTKQTHDMMNRLSVLQRNEREIKKLAVIANGGKTSTSASKAPASKTSSAPVIHAAAPLPGRPSVTPRVSFWDGVRSWLASRSADAVTFANESTALASLNVKLESALAESRDLEAKASAAAQAKIAADIARQRFLDAIPSIWPTDGYVSSGFGYRDYPDAEFHPGLDIVNDYGAPVYATASGVVEEAGWDYGYGYKIVIDHGNGYETWYAHNSRMLVSPGDSVRKGEQIAEIGTSGFATGPHCHYEIVLWGKPIDPTPYLDGIPAQVASAR